MVVGLQVSRKAERLCYGENLQQSLISEETFSSRHGGGRRRMFSGDMFVHVCAWGMGWAMVSQTCLFPKC